LTLRSRYRKHLTDVALSLQKTSVTGVALSLQKTSAKEVK